jgi:very-short-patch-repair endonuclease
VVGRKPRIPPELTARPFSLDEARAAGLSLSALRGKSWRRVGSKMYRLSAAGEDRLALVKAYGGMLGHAAVFVARTAAWVHGLDVDPANPVQVALPADSEVRSRAGLEVRHCDLRDEVERVRGVRVTKLSRTLLDVCARSSAVDSLVILDMAVCSRRLRQEDLVLYARQMNGRPGAAQLRSLAPLAAAAESAMETRLRWLLIQAKLPAPEVQTDLYDNGGRFVARADLFYPRACLVIEFDGGNHRERLISDDRRQNGLVTAGYRVLRFTGADVRDRPKAIVEEVRAGLT